MAVVEMSATVAALIVQAAAKRGVEPAQLAAVSGFDLSMSLAQAASALHMSERSLQRKLAHEGHSFDALLDELRRDLALRYLQDPRIASAEIAFLLGYSEASAFQRAFKRWTGVTPREMRRRAG